MFYRSSAFSVKQPCINTELRKTPSYLCNITFFVTIVIIVIIIITAGPAQAPGAAPHPRASVAAPGPSAAPRRLGPAAGRTTDAKTCRWRSGPTTGWKTAAARSAAAARRRRLRRRLYMHATCLARLLPQRLVGSDSRAQHVPVCVVCVRLCPRARESGWACECAVSTQQTLVLLKGSERARQHAR